MLYSQNPLVDSEGVAFLVESVMTNVFWENIIYHHNPFVTRVLEQISSDLPRVLLHQLDSAASRLSIAAHDEMSPR